MSYGVFCLTCRKYVRAEFDSALDAARHGCTCVEPVPTVDGKTAATPAEVKRGLELSKQQRKL